MTTEEFTKAYETYSNQNSKNKDQVTPKSLDELKEEYHQDVRLALTDQFKTYIEQRFSKNGYFVKFAHAKTCKIIVYGAYTLGIDIMIRSYTFPGYDKREHLDNADLLHRAEFHISHPWTILSLNKKSKDPDKIAEKISNLYADIVNEHNGECFANRLSAMNGVNKVKSIDHSRATLVIKGKSELEFFLGGFAAISNPMLSDSEEYFKQLERSYKIAVVRNWAILILLLIIGYWIFF